MSHLCSKLNHYPGPGRTNHAVTVVGWDDDVPHPNPRHSGTGAWIIKNSWGTADSWAGGAGVSDGYFYLAYNSSRVKRIIHLEYRDPVPGEELLYWDEAGYVRSFGYGDINAWMASDFTADQASNLTHVDFWTTSNNVLYKIYVWDGFGTQLAHQTGLRPKAGYYSIPLSAPISIDAGQQFVVAVKMTTPGYNYPIPVECEIPGRVEPSIQSGVSYVRNGDDDPWEDFADYGANACLRARMAPLENSITNIELSPPSPAWLEFNEHVNITFDYSTNEAGGARISVRPYTRGSLTPNYVAHGSPLYPVGSGSGSGWFTITSGTVTVDQLRFQMWNADYSELLLEFFIDVGYHFREKPTISIKTDKKTYKPGDKMTTTIIFKNPSGSNVDTVFAWYLSIPAYDYWQQMYVSALTLPANYDKSVTMPIDVGDWGKKSFNAEWHVWLVEPFKAHTIISHDDAKWSYIPGKKAQGETMPADIAKEITKEIEGVELPGKKAQGETVPVEIVEELTKEKKE